MAREPAVGHDRVVLFDGECNLCDATVDRLLRLDRRRRLRFGALQSERGRELLERHGGSADMESIVYLRDGELLERSSAALHIARDLGGIPTLAFALVVVPPFIRDRVYDWVARNRYRWFGRRDTCRVPTPGERARFLD